MVKEWAQAQMSINIWEEAWSCGSFTFSNERTGAQVFRTAEGSKGKNKTKEREKDCKCLKAISWYSLLEGTPTRQYCCTTRTTKKPNLIFAQVPPTISDNNADHVFVKFHFAKKFDVLPFIGVKKELLFDCTGELRKDSFGLQGDKGCANTTSYHSVK